jgi:asparagine synthase (glutamine-hydrolysing)
MCGIAGIAALRPVNRAAVVAMTSLLAHRGPDGDGLWASPDGRIVFGHRRLAVIDVSDAGRQPMTDGTGEIAITFNGEIYNYVELAAELRAQGAVFRTGTDTEVILEAWRSWGEDCVSHFNGMFAFALHDARTGTVFCARDRFGEKPFYFAAGDGFVAFASEYKALFALAPLPVAPDMRPIVSFLAGTAPSLDFGPGTPFAGVSQLCPGECLTLDAGTLEIRRRTYWTPPAGAAGERIAFPDAVAGFRRLLTDSVRLRLRSDVPLGSCLSGGLDSGSIYGLVRDIVGDGVPYNVFTGRFPGSAADEGAFADAIAKRGNAVRHEVAPDPDRLAAELGDFLWHNELPVDSASQYAQWCVFRLAAEVGVTVLLDGQGSDEVLGGYEQYFAAYLASRTADGADTAAEEVAIRARYPAALSMRDQAWKRRGPLALRKLAARALGRGTDFLFGVSAAFASGSPGDPPGPVPLSAALRRDAHGGFLTTLLRYGDRNSMAHSREVRLPFCDHRILEFALSLPAEHLMGEAQTKRLLREAMRGVLPESIRTRWNKQGFVPPIADWLDRGLIDAVAARVEAPAFRADPVWDAGWWRAALKRYRAGDRALAPSLWKIFVADAWKEHFVARAAALQKHAPFA